MSNNQITRLRASESLEGRPEETTGDRNNDPVTITIRNGKVPLSSHSAGWVLCSVPLQIDAAWLGARITSL